MRFFSTGEAAKRLGVTRDSLFASLRAGAPDTMNTIGGRRCFNDDEIDKLAAWYERRRRIRDGLIRLGEGGDDESAL